MGSITHTFVNPASDLAGFTGAKPSDWNATHTLTNIAQLDVSNTFTADQIVSGAYLRWAGTQIVSSQFDKTSDTTLANIPGLSVNVSASGVYIFTATLFTTSNVAGGVKAAVGGTCTATSIVYEGEATAAAAIGAQTRASALGTAVAGVTAVTAARIDIIGTITVNAGGTLTIQFAQNTSNGTASSVLVGSYMIVQRIS